MAFRIPTHLLLLIVLKMLVATVTGLQTGYYETSCPQAEMVVREAVKAAMLSDITVPAALLRMHFHDCFIRGCDGSVLIDSSGGNKAEKDGPPNVSLHAFFVIDNAKAKLESLCPATVSCADILALAARDAVVLAGGPEWAVEVGRKDGRISRAFETRGLPAPTLNVTQLLSSFAERGLSAHDLVALSGGHTLGFAHCSSFQNRIHGFSSTQDVDPGMDPSLASTLRALCPAPNTQRNAGAFLDSTARSFDNQYYQNLLQSKGLFSSDATLYSDHLGTRQLVQQFASSQELFFEYFVKSMVKMSGIPGQGAQEIRLSCRKPN